MDYGQIISKGWKTTWENKWLWILGFFASLGTGVSSGVNSTFDSGFTSFGNTFNPENIDPSAINEEALIGTLLAAFSLVLILVFLLSIIAFVVGVASRAGLISGVYKTHHGQNASFGTEFRAGLGKFFPIFLFKILLALPFIVITIIMVVGIGILIGASVSTAIAAEDPAAIFGLFGTAAICFLPATCLLVILSILIGFVDALGYRGIVLNNLSPVNGLKHGWEMFRNNAMDVFLLAVIFGVIGFIFNLIVGAILGLFAFASGAPLLLDVINGNEISGGDASLLAVGILVVTIIGTFLYAVFTTWQSATFTYGYMHWAGLDTVENRSEFEKSPDDFDFI